MTPRKLSDRSPAAVALAVLLLVLVLANAPKAAPGDEIPQKTRPPATREFVAQGTKDETWVVRTHAQTLEIPARYVGPHDIDRAFFHLFLYWPGLDPFLKVAHEGRNYRDLVQVLLTAEITFVPRRSPESLIQYSKWYGEPIPNANFPGLLEYPNTGTAGYRAYLAVDVFPPSVSNDPIFISCGPASECRARYYGFPRSQVLVDFYSEKLPQAKHMLRDVLALLHSFYVPNHGVQRTPASGRR